MGANSSRAVLVSVSENRSSVSYCPLPCSVFDIVVKHPGFKLLDGKKYFKTKKLLPMYFGDELKAKRVYFLLPVNEDGSFKDDPDLYGQLKTIKKKMGRDGRNLVFPVFSVSAPN